MLSVGADLSVTAKNANKASVKQLSLYEGNFDVSKLCSDFFKLLTFSSATIVKHNKTLFTCYSQLFKVNTLAHRRTAQQLLIVRSLFKHVERGFVKSPAKLFNYLSRPGNQPQPGRLDGRGS